MVDEAFLLLISPSVAGRAQPSKQEIRTSSQFTCIHITCHNRCECALFGLVLIPNRHIATLEPPVLRCIMYFASHRVLNPIKLSTNGLTDAFPTDASPPLAGSSTSREAASTHARSERQRACRCCEHTQQQIPTTAICQQLDVWLSARLWLWFCPPGRQQLLQCNRNTH